MFRAWSPTFRASLGRGRIGCVLALVVLHQLPGLGELLVRHLEACTRATHPLDALVFLDLLTGPGEAVARFAEQLTRLPHPRHRGGELVRGLAQDVVVLASLRPSVHAAWHAYPVPRTPVPQPLALVLHPAREPAMMRSPTSDASRPLLGRPWWPIAPVASGAWPG